MTNTEQIRRKELKRSYLAEQKTAERTAQTARVAKFWRDMTEVEKATAEGRLWNPTPDAEQTRRVFDAQINAGIAANYDAELGNSYADPANSRY